MNMKKTISILLLVILCGCTQRGCQKMEKQFQFSERNYHITQYSGGKIVGDYKFYGILNDSEGSDGYFFFKQDTLIEVSGDLTIKSWK